MKHINFTSPVVVTIAILVFAILFCFQTLATQNRITLVRKNFAFQQTETVGTQIVEYYTITIILKNTRSEATDDITLELLDEYELPVSKNHTFMSQESKTFVFDDYIVIGPQPHFINISVYPTNEKGTILLKDQIILNNLNNNNETHSTPDFTIVSVFIAISFFGSIARKYRFL